MQGKRGGALRRRLVVACAAGLLAASPVAAVTIPFDVEFDTGATGSFGSLDVVQSGDALEFSVSVDTASLGLSADLHQLAFNLVPDPSGLAVTTLDPVAEPYTLSMGPLAGSAGSDFDWVVGFGSGAGPSGNGTLQMASFRISADSPLALADLSEPSFPNNVDTSEHPVLFALHVQSTESVFGGDSETVGGGPPGGVIPEPGTALLLGSGLVGLAVAGRRRR